METLHICVKELLPPMYCIGMRMGHAGVLALERTASIVHGMESFKKRQSQLCISFIKINIKRVPQKANGQGNRKILKPLHLLHSDFCGQIACVNRKG